MDGFRLGPLGVIGNSVCVRDCDGQGQRYKSPLPFEKARWLGPLTHVAVLERSRCLDQQVNAKTE
jgi:hypothetical protein